MVKLTVHQLSIYLSIYLSVLTPEGDIRRVPGPGNQVLGVSFVFFVSFCAMLVVLVVSERFVEIPEHTKTPEHTNNQ